MAGIMFSLNYLKMVTNRIYFTILFLFIALVSFAQQAELSVQTGHNSAIQKLCYSPDGKILASADIQNKIILWDMETGGQMVKFYMDKETENSISCITFSCNGNYLIIGTASGFVYVYNVTISKEINRLAYSHSIKSVTFSNDNNNVFVVADKLYKMDIVNLNYKIISDQPFIHFSRKGKDNYLLINTDGQAFNLNKADSLVENNYSLYDQDKLKNKKLHQAILTKKLDLKIATTTKLKKKTRLEQRKSFSNFYFYRIGITRAILSDDGETLYSNVTNGKIKAIRLADQKELFIRTSIYFDENFTSLALCNKYNLLFASNTDNKIYVMDSKTGKIKKYLKNHLSNVNDVAISPDENYLASASGDRSIIIWNCKTLEPVRRLYSRAFSITSMEVSKDGNILAFADEIGYVKTIDLNSIMLDINSISAHNQSVPSIGFTKNDSTFISAGNDNKLKLIDFNSSQILGKATFKRYFQLNMVVSDILEMLGVYIPPKAQIDSLIFNNTGNTFTVFGGRIRKGKYRYARYEETFDAQTMNRIGSEKTGHEKFKDYFYYNKFVNLSDTAKFGINFYNKTTGHTEKITGIKEVKAKHIVITSSLDATLKIWDTNSKKILLTLIPVDKNKLIKLTSDNFYMAPKNALTAIGFKYGMSFFPPEQFDVRFNRPDKVMTEFGSAPPILLKAYEMAFNKRLKKLNLTQDLLGNDFHAPEILVNDISSQLNTSDKTVKFKAIATDSKYKLSRINVYNNDIPVFGTKGIDVKDKNSSDFSDNIEVNLIPGKNKIQVSCLNEKGVESFKKTFEIIQNKTDIKPNLYIVTIGVSKYNDNRFNLNYAAKDANDVALMFSQNKNNYGSVFSKTLTDSTVTKENIIALKNFLKESKPNDVVIVFLAGHGLLDEQFNYYFGTFDLDFNNPSLRGIEYSEIENILDGIPAMKKILFMDTCHSGEADKDELELTSETIVETGNVKFRNAGVGVRNKKALGMYNTNEIMKDVFADIRKGTGSTVVSSAGATEFAFEGKSWSNGLFTYCLLKGIKDKEADLNNDKMIVLSELQEYIRKNVTSLSGGMQVPNARLENISMDFRVW